MSSEPRDAPVGAHLRTAKKSEVNASAGASAVRQARFGPPLTALVGYGRGWFATTMRAMCNRYRAASVVRIRDVFGFTYIESGPPLYRTDGIGPWQMGPFLRAGSAEVGQWGLIPWFSATRRPTGKGGRPISTNNCRIETAASAPTFKGSWVRGQRCIIPAEDFDEPYWGTGKNIWWRFRRADGMPWGLAGLWSEWRDPQSGEIILSYTMLTQNCDGHPVLGLMHKPDPTLPAEQQDKRSVVALEAEHWQQWLNGSVDDALRLVAPPRAELICHGPADAQVQAALPI